MCRQRAARYRLLAAEFAAIDHHRTCARRWREQTVAAVNDPELPAGLRDWWFALGQECTAWLDALEAEEHDTGDIPQRRQLAV